MNTQKKNKRINFFFALFSAVLLIIIGLIFATDDAVLAQNESDVETGYDIKEAVFGTNLDVERSSRKPKLVRIKKGDYVYNVFTVETDIYKILGQYKINIEDNVKISISTEHIVDGTLIRVIQTETVIEDITEDIPFATETVKSYELFEGQKNVVQEGVLGAKTKRVLSYYEDGVLKESTILMEKVVKEPVKKITEIGASIFSLDGIEKRGYNCPYWDSVVDSGPYSDEEKTWLKFIMKCESGCNAELNSNNNKTYKGLFQYSPTTWKKRYTENIFDGYAQIRNTVEKYRSGESTRKSQWPACHKKFLREVGY